jgi:aromatic-L-amino-acid/L-tryptophan decarboxylase
MTETRAGPDRAPVPAGGDGVGTPLTDLRRDGQAALEWAASYLERVGALPVLAQVAPGDIRAGLPAHAPHEPEPFSAVLRDLDEILLPGVTHWQHPRFFAYFATSASEPAILAELLAATLNSVAFLWRTAPAATELEGVVLDWVAELLGLPAGWHGHIEDTASTSTFAACVAAREATGRDLIVCSEQAHSAADKAAHMLGMRLRKVPVDSEFRMRGEAVGDLSDAAVIVATVGTTAVTAVDAVGEIADVCAESGTWLHVDAAYAGAAMVCPEYRWAFDGVERADSLVVNAHKWMLTPMDCSLLWTRRREDFRRAFSVVPEFLRTPDAEDSLSLSEFGPALGRRFRALKLWAVLRCHGRSGLQRHIRSGIELAEKFEKWVAGADRWEVCAPRRFSVVCFRLVGEDERNRRLLDRVNGSGEMFISHATLHGRYVLRLAIGGMSTTETDVRRAWEVLLREAERV